MRNKFHSLENKPKKETFLASFKYVRTSLGKFHASDNLARFIQNILSTTFHKNDILCEYIGERVTPEESRLRLYNLTEKQVGLLDF